MAQSQSISLNENNDENINFAITTNQPSPGTVLNLTGDTVEFYLKQSATTADTDASTWKATIAGGNVTITNAAGGLVSVYVPAAQVVDTKKWFRLDVIDGTGKRKTAVYGSLAVVDM